MAVPQSVCNLENDCGDDRKRFKSPQSFELLFLIVSFIILENHYILNLYICLSRQAAIYLEVYQVRRLLGTIE
ncbi:hypothetical protein [Leptospira kirschneri]|uniref:hypothetical protein n=1 Tax=Leptospira kirschneri TaxID=29507 RepID=UPI000302E8BC|nr:hypothetical protein [Leptospira kirschneri]